MPTYKVRRRVDAFIDYTSEVEAANPHEAAKLAARMATALPWTREGQHELDAQAFLTLDPAGNEIAESEQGDFI